MADLSKIKLGEQIYTLKDAQGRTNLQNLINSLKQAAYRDVATAISDGEGKIADAALVKAYVDAQVGSIHKFDIVIVSVLPTASAETMYKLYLTPKAGSESQNVKEEWITVRSGEEGAYTYAWEKIGDTAVDLSGYVQKTQTIAGIDLQDNITVNELQTALGLGELAYKDSATGTVEGQTITDVKASGTSTGSLEGDLGYDSTAVASTGKFTPQGTVSGGKVTATGSISGAIKADAENGVQIGGTISAPTITVTPATAEVQHLDSVGTLPTYTEGAFTGGSFAKGNAVQAAIEGMVAAMDTTDTEMLVLTPAQKDNVMDYDASYTAATYAGATFTQGTLPTLGTAQTVVTGIQSASASTPVFTGYKYAFEGSFAGNEVNVTGASFSGTEGDLSVSGNYDKANLGTVAFKGEDIELDVGNIVVAEKSVTVE